MYAPDSLTPDQLQRFLTRLAQEGTTLFQDRLLCRLLTATLLMADAGLRVGEACALRYEHAYFDFAPVPTLALPPEITKTKIARDIPISDRLRTQLITHGQMCEPTPQWHPSHFLLHATDPAKPLSVRSVERHLKRHAETVLDLDIHPHTLRHTFANRLKNKTDLATLQQLLGHKKLTSTQIYLHPDHHDRRSAIDKLT